MRRLCIADRDKAFAASKTREKAQGQVTFSKVAKRKTPPVSLEPNVQRVKIKDFIEPSATKETSADEAILLGAYEFEASAEESEEIEIKIDPAEFRDTPTEGMDVLNEEDLRTFLVTKTDTQLTEDNMENLANEILQTTNQSLSKEDLISGLTAMIETARKESLTRNLPFDQEPQRPLTTQPTMSMTFRPEQSTARPEPGITPRSPPPEQRRRRAPRSPPSRTSSSSRDRRPHIQYALLKDTCFSRARLRGYSRRVRRHRCLTLRKVCELLDAK